MAFAKNVHFLLRSECAELRKRLDGLSSSPNNPFGRPERAASFANEGRSPASNATISPSRIAAWAAEQAAERRQLAIGSRDVVAVDVGKRADPTGDPASRAAR
jgi:hypothetical protein